MKFNTQQPMDISESSQQSYLFQQPLKALVYFGIVK